MAGLGPPIMACVDTPGSTPHDLAHELPLEVGTTLLGVSLLSLCFILISRSVNGPGRARPGRAETYLGSTLETTHLANQARTGLSITSFFFFAAPF